MSAAPAGAQAGAARCCHRAKSFGLAVGVCGDLNPSLSHCEPPETIL